jgi:hypothetical protein
MGSRPAALTNKKHENSDQIQANNLIKLSRVSIKRKKYKKYFFLLKDKRMKHLKTCCAPNLSLDLPMHVNKNQAHLVT